MNRADMLLLLAAWYSLTLDERGRIVAVKPESLADNGIPTNPEEENPLPQRERERWR